MSVQRGHGLSAEVTLAIALAVHGGAWNIPNALCADAQIGVSQALAQGWEGLRAGASAIDTVELVVRLLEDDPNFDAGRGSRLNSDGKVQMDASIMEGDDLRAGAVAAIERVRHPISVARAVLERTAHVLLVGRDAHRFAASVGAELCRTRDLLVGRERERFDRVRRGERRLIDQEFCAEDPGPLGTVGAVARDRAGRFAAATSTGGTQDKRPGRVGDSAIPGAGTYADRDAGAVSATGWGEGILRVVLAKTAIDRMAAGESPDRAGRMALASLSRVGGFAGLILVDRVGRAAAVFTTPRMARGWVTETAGPFVAVESDAGLP